MRGGRGGAWGLPIGSGVRWRRGVGGPGRKGVALANGGEGRGLSLANLEKEERGGGNGVVGRLASGPEG